MIDEMRSQTNQEPLIKKMVKQEDEQDLTSANKSDSTTHKPAQIY